MELVTGDEMASIDRFTIEEIGLPGVVLMERAGQQIMEAAVDLIDDLTEAEVVVLAGSGNNGGDGFVVARLLAQRGISVEVFRLGAKSGLSGDARTNLDVLANLGLTVKELTSRSGVDNLESVLARADLVIDSLLGTGIKGELRGLYPDLIRLINQVETGVLAVDIPSGVEAASGRVRTTAVKAERTVTFGRPKRGLLLYPGADYTGEWEVVDIGIPQSAVDDQSPSVELLTGDQISSLLPKRVPASHKGDYGRLLILAGSTGLTGAAVLTARTSLRAGSGLVTVGLPEDLNSILETKLTEAMTYPLPAQAGSLVPAALPQIKELAADREVIVLGPGLGRADSTGRLVSSLLELAKPLVIDADGLNLIADLELLDRVAARRKAPTVLTPHPGELARLRGTSVADIQCDRLAIARESATDYSLCLVLKGARTVIAAPEAKLYVNQTGNSGLATGGSGDLLTGLIASFLGQGVAPLTAARLGVYLQGRAADLAAAELTEYSLLPSDLLDYLPEAIAELKQ